MLFISHSSEDKERVRVLKEALEEEGLHVWLDEKEIAPGTLLSETLSHNIAEATGLVLVGSAAAMRSRWVDLELNYAVEQGIPIIPVSWEDIDWPAKYQFLFAGALRGRLRDGEEPEAAKLIWKALSDQMTRVGGILKPNILSVPKRRNPAALLNARYRIVPFFDEPRTRELELLTSWCKAAEPGVSVRLFTGPGGSGKTRLFIEWTSRLRDRRQMPAGFLREQATFDELRVLARSPEAAFVVIDYAETRLKQLNDLLAMLSDRPASLPTIHVALLVRANSDWREHLDTSARNFLNAHEPWRLEPVSLESNQRERAFKIAYEAFADGKGEPSAFPQLEDALFERMLYIHMAALASLQGRRLASEELLSDTLAREIRFWFPAGEAPRGFNRRASRLVAAVTLRGRTSRKALIGLDRRVQGPDDPEFRDLMGDLYAPVTDPVGNIVGGLEPDLLGEALVSQVLSDPETQDDFLESTFEDADAKTLENGFVVLGRIGLWAPELITNWVSPFFNKDVLKRTLPAMNALLSLGTTTTQKPEGSLLLKAIREFIEEHANFRGDKSSEVEIPWAGLVSVGYALSLVSASSRLTYPSAFGILARQGHIAEAATLARMSQDAEGLALVSIAASDHNDPQLALELLREAFPLFANSYSDENHSAVVDAVCKFGEQEDYQRLFNQYHHPSVLAFFLGDGAQLVEPGSFAQFLEMLVESGPPTLASAALHAPPGNIPKDVLLRLAESVRTEESGYAAKAMSETAGALMRMGQADEAIALARRALELGTRIRISNWIALAEAFDAAEMVGERERALERALAMLSDSSDGFGVQRVAGELARYWRVRGDGERIDWLAQWLEGRQEQNRDFPDLCEELARWYASEGRDELAVRWARAVESDHTDGSCEQSAWGAAAQGFAKAGDHEKAGEAAETAAGFGYKSSYAFAKVAEILYDQGRRNSAETLARRSIAAAAREAVQRLETECWSQLAKALAAGERRAKAHDLLQRASSRKGWRQVSALLALDQVDQALHMARTGKSLAVIEVLMEAVQARMAKGDRDTAAMLVDELARLTGLETMHANLTEGALAQEAVEALLYYCEARIALEPDTRSSIVKRIKVLVDATFAEMDSGIAAEGVEMDPWGQPIGPSAEERLAHLGLFLAKHQDRLTARQVLRHLDVRVRQIPDFDRTDEDFETGEDFLRLPNLSMQIGLGWHRLGDYERSIPILLTALRILEAPKKSRDIFTVSYLPKVMEESVCCLAEVGADESLENRLSLFSPDKLAYAARGLLKARRPQWAARTASVALCRAAEQGDLDQVHEVVGIIADVVLATGGVNDIIAAVDAMDRVVDWWS